MINDILLTGRHRRHASGFGVPYNSHGGRIYNSGVRDFRRGQGAGHMKIGAQYYLIVISLVILSIAIPCGKSTTDLIIEDCNLSGAEIFVLEDKNSTYNISFNITNSGSETLPYIVIHFILDEYVDIGDLSINSTIEQNKTMNVCMQWIIDKNIKPGLHNMTIQVTDKRSIELYATFFIQFSVKCLSVAEFVVGYFTVDPDTIKNVPIGEKRMFNFNFSIHNIGDQYGETKISIYEWDNTGRIKAVLLNYSVGLNGHGKENISVKWNVSKEGTHTVMVSLAGKDDIAYYTRETKFGFWNKPTPQHENLNNLFPVEFTCILALILLIAVILVILIIKFGPK